MKIKSKKRNCPPVQRSNPKLWESVKRSILKGSKGGLPNKWSARKSQLAVAIYKKKGGKYIGKKLKCNSLTKWSKEKWNYISPSSSSPRSLITPRDDKRSSNKRKGRYLPEIVRKHLSRKEKQIENKRKGSKRGKWVSYSPSVTKKMKKYGII